MFKKIISYALLLLLALPLWGAEIDTVFNGLFRRDIGGWIAADATFSILLPDGRTLWLFGDTFLGEVDENNAIKPGSKFVRNTAVIQDGENMSTLYGGNESNPVDFILTNYPDSTWYWPEHGIVENDTLRIFVARYRNNPDAPSGFNFEYEGNDIANFSYPGLQFISRTAVKCSELNSVIYGDRVLEDNGYVYIYGRKNDDPEVNIPYPHVARTKRGDLMMQDWEFFDGNNWSGDPQATKRINSFQVSQQYSVTKYREKYILLTQDIWLSPKIWTFTSATPVGPWENKTLIYITPESIQDMFTYNAYAHPQFNSDGELLVSYNTNGDFWSIFTNVEIYRPRFIRVPYMNLDYDFWPTENRRNLSSKGIDISVFPNPVTDIATLSINLRQPGNVSIEFLDINGRLLHTIPVKFLYEGLNFLDLEMHQFPAGIYYCRVVSNAQAIVVPIIKSSKL